MASCKSVEIFKENVETRPSKTYQSYVIVNREIGQRGFNDEFLDALVADRIIEILDHKGLVYDRGKPDLIIRYTSNEDLRQKETVMYPNQMWGMRVWDPWMFDPRFANPRGMVRTSNFELFQVIVDFIDGPTDKMLMRLTAVSEVSNPKEKKRKTKKSVEKIMETYIEHVKR